MKALTLKMETVWRKDQPECDIVIQEADVWMESEPEADVQMEGELQTDQERESEFVGRQVVDSKVRILGFELVCM